MYDKKAKWHCVESDHFFYKFFPDLIIKKNIDNFIRRTEDSYNKISKFLDVTPGKKFDFYLLPDKKTSNRLNIETNIAVPHKHFVSMVFDEYQFSINKLSFGHEITHLLSYFWDKQLFHLEFLEEGLAVYLDQSESDKHLDFLNKLHSRIDNGYIDLSLNIEYVKRATDYVKAGSFVKYLIESYGIKKFKKLYLRSVVELRNDIYVINGKRLPKNYLKILLKECYGENPTSIQRKWLENVGIIL